MENENSIFQDLESFEKEDFQNGYGTFFGFFYRKILEIS